MIGVSYAAFSRRWASNEDGGKGWARWSLGVLKCIVLYVLRGRFELSEGVMSCIGEARVLRAFPNSPGLGALA